MTRACADRPEVALTIREAADFLNVSQPYLSRLLDSGKLPYCINGIDTLVPLHELQAHRTRQDAASEAALAELQAQAQELDMGY